MGLPADYDRNPALSSIYVYMTHIEGNVGLPETPTLQRFKSSRFFLQTQDFKLYLSGGRRIRTRKSFRTVDFKSTAIPLGEPSSYKVVLSVLAKKLFCFHLKNTFQTV